MIPTIDKTAMNSGRNPFLRDIVQIVPVVISEGRALGSPEHGIAVVIHGDIELKRLCNAYIGHVDIGVVGKVVERRNKRFALIGK